MMIYIQFKIILFYSWAMLLSSLTFTAVWQETWRECYASKPSRNLQLIMQVWGPCSYKGSVKLNSCSHYYSRTNSLRTYLITFVGCATEFTLGFFKVTGTGFELVQELQKLAFNSLKGSLGLNVFCLKSIWLFYNEGTYNEHHSVSFGCFFHEFNSWSYPCELSWWQTQFFEYPWFLSQKLNLTC